MNSPSTSTTSETVVSFETTVLPSEARQAIGRTHWRFYLLVGVITFGLMAIFRLQRPWRDTWDLITDLIAYAIGVAIGIVGIGFVLLFRGSARAARRSNANGPMRYRVSDGGVAMEDNITTAQLKWPVFAGFADLKSLIVLRLKQRRMVLIIPKRCLSDAAEADLIKILSKRLPKLG